MAHSIFIRFRGGNRENKPELLAYDIEEVSLANRLVRHIAKSYKEHGHDNAGRRWYKSKDGLFSVYRMRQCV